MELGKKLLAQEAIRLWVRLKEGMDELGKMCEVDGPDWNHRKARIMMRLKDNVEDWKVRRNGRRATRYGCGEREQRQGPRNVLWLELCGQWCGNNDEG